KVGTRESLATPKPGKSRLLLRWSPTGKLFDNEGKIVDSSESKSQLDCSNGDNACTSNAMKPKIKRFPNSTSLLDRKPNISFLHVFGALCYPKNDREDIGKLGAKGDTGFFIGYSVDSSTARTIPPAQEPQVRQSSTASTAIADTAPIPTNSSSLATNIPITS
nr:integrase, catalytic region, zinc finger, CCHC-type, peptidase aspartic, catalytic [Tanacetum cinerariifolium]